MPAKIVKAEIHTRDFKIVGAVHLSSESYRSRLSDRLNTESSSFIPVTQAKIWRKESGKITVKKPREVECIIVSARSIEATIPLEE